MYAATFVAVSIYTSNTGLLLAVTPETVTAFDPAAVNTGKVHVVYFVAAEAVIVVFVTPVT